VLLLIEQCLINIQCLIKGVNAMTIKERKEREREEMRDLIINAAGEIIKKEGTESLSIRKIAARIEYSPAIIYHYFKDKDEIVNSLLKTSYQKITRIMSSVQVSSDSPEQKLEEMFRNYINWALEMPDEYMAIMLSSSPAIIEHTSVLFKGASFKRPAIGIFFQCLKEIYKNLDDALIELTAQVLWTATFGLIIRLITEKDLDMDQRKMLIEHQIKLTVDVIVTGKSLSNCLKEDIIK
jgi:AcrR family transcriptional regulator